MHNSRETEFYESFITRQLRAQIRILLKFHRMNPEAIATALNNSLNGYHLSVMTVLRVISNEYHDDLSGNNEWVFIEDHRFKQTFFPPWRTGRHAPSVIWSPQPSWAGYHYGNSHGRDSYPLNDPSRGHIPPALMLQSTTLNHPVHSAGDKESSPSPSPRLDEGIPIPITPILHPPFHQHPQLPSQACPHYHNTTSPSFGLDQPSAVHIATNNPLSFSVAKLRDEIAGPSSNDHSESGSNIEPIRSDSVPRSMANEDIDPPQVQHNPMLSESPTTTQSNSPLEVKIEEQIPMMPTQRSPHLSTSPPTIVKESVSDSEDLTTPPPSPKQQKHLRQIPTPVKENAHPIKRPCPPDREPIPISVPRLGCPLPLTFRNREASRPGDSLDAIPPTPPFETRVRREPLPLPLPRPKKVRIETPDKPIPTRKSHKHKDKDKRRASSSGTTAPTSTAAVSNTHLDSIHQFLTDLPIDLSHLHPKLKTMKLGTPDELFAFSTFEEGQLHELLKESLPGLPPPHRFILVRAIREKR